MTPVKPRQLPQTIPEAFAAICRQASHRIAMQMKAGDGYRRYTYQEMAKQVGELAAGLIRQDLRRGDRVAIVAENRPEWVIAYLGILAAGGTAVPLDIQLSSPDLGALLARSGSRMVFTSSRTWSLIQDLPSRPMAVGLDLVGGSDVVDFDQLLSQCGTEPVDHVKIDPDDVASLLYTSGTTGEPKGVLLTHWNFVSNAQALISSGLAGSDDNFLVMLPLHHTYPFMTACLVPLMLGAKMTFLQSLKGSDLIQCLQETQITMLVGVPQVFAMVKRAIFDQLSRHPRPIRVIFTSLLVLAGLVRQHTGINLGRVVFGTVHRRFGGSLRLLCSGGAKLDPEVAQDLERLGFTIREGYGLTETAPVVTFNTLARSKIGSVGCPIADVEVKVIHPNDQGIGDIAVRGPNVMKGYDGNPAVTAEAICDGWFHTGDVGYLDQEGYLFLTGRSKELIVTPGGKNIYPEELEREYAKSPAIADLCLIGSKQTGEAEGVHAVVLPNFDFLKTFNIFDVRQHIKDELTRIGLALPPYKRIMGVTLVKEPLPRTRLGKLQRHKVAVLLEQEQGHGKEPSVVSEQDQAIVDAEPARKVIAALTRLIPKPKPICLDDHLDLDLGLDSLRRVELIATLEQSFGSLPDTLTTEVVTVRNLIDKLSTLVHGEAEEKPQGPQSWHDLLKAAPSIELTDRLLVPPSFFYRLVTTGARLALWLVFRMVFRLSTKGLENVPRRGPFLLAPNHVSYADPFVVLVSVPPAVFDHLFTVGWEAYFRGWVRAWVARVGHIILVGKDTSLVTVLQTAATVLRHGKGLLIFPEGERSIDGRLLPFRKGIGVLACELGVPVLPIWITGTYRVLPAGARWPRRHPIALYVGKPFTITADLIDQWEKEEVDPYEAAAQLIREHVTKLAKDAAG